MPCSSLSPVLLEANLDMEGFQRGQLLALVWGLGIAVVGHALVFLISIL